MRLHKLRSYVVAELGVYSCHARNKLNEKEEIKFNGQGRVCSKNALTFASWCGCIVRKRTNAPLMAKN